MTLQWSSHGHAHTPAVSVRCLLLPTSESVVRDRGQVGAQASEEELAGRLVV
jgi:hypothetical protein